MPFFYLWAVDSCSSTILTSAERYMFPNFKASHVVCLQVWLVDRVVDIGRTACQWSACPHGIGMQGLRSSCRLGTKLRAAGFDGLTSKPMWNSSENPGSKLDRTIALLFWTHDRRHIKRTHNKAIGYKRNAHICLLITRVSISLVGIQDLQSRSFVTQNFVLFWHSVLRPRWVKGLWTAFMQFDRAGHVSCQLVSIMCHLFRN